MQMNESHNNRKLPLKKRTYTDVLGIEIGNRHPAGNAVVRVRRRGHAIEIMAVGYLSGVTDTLPTNWEEASKRIEWALKGEWQAPHAAFAVTSAEGHLALSTREEQPTELNVPISNEGSRSITHAVFPPNIYLEAVLPEYQVIWLSRLLPEGHQPTAASIQVYQSAVLNALTFNPVFKQIGETAFVAIVLERLTLLVTYNEGHLVLYREYPLGREQIRQALQQQLGMEESLLEGMLNEKLIDPMPVLTPLLNPLFRQVQIALDYLVHRTTCEVKQCLLLGVNTGVEYWQAAYTTAGVAIPLQVVHLFEGSTLPKKLPATFQESDFFGAYGAACAVLGDD